MQLQATDVTDCPSAPIGIGFEDLFSCCRCSEKPILKEHALRGYQSYRYECKCSPRKDGVYSGTLAGAVRSWNTRLNELADRIVNNMEADQDEEK
jgi:hypothetical protein